MGSVHHNSPMLAKTSAFLIWAAVAGAAVFWGLHLSGSAPEAPAHAQPAPVATVVRSDLGRLLGPDPASPSAESQAPLAVAQQSRFQLLGVIAAGSGGPAGSAGPGGWATLAVDGKPPRTFRELGSQMGVCKERIRQIQTRAMEKLREMAAEARLEQTVGDWL